jgi:hypothetical protein
VEDERKSQMERQRKQEEYQQQYQQPDGVYGPRDCLIMLLEDALRHMPQEADVVARCMRALAPLSLEEYEECVGSLSNLENQAPRALGECTHCEATRRG